MFRKVILFAVMIMVIINVSTVFAQTQTSEKIIVDTKDLPPGVVEQLKTKQQIERLGKFAGVGKEIGEAVNSSLEAITDNADKFAKTRVGVFTMVLVAYKIIGKDLIQFLIGVPFFVVGNLSFDFFPSL